MTTFSKLGLFSLATTAAFAILGCNKAGEREPNTDRSDMTPAARTRSAAEQISQARCEREQQCGNIGPDKTFSSSQDCLVRIQNDWKEDLDSRQCPGGINQHELNECMAQVRAEACANPFDTLARITECTSGQVCIEQP
jgi:Family of unknown function (DUF6184)